jgi:uroporphyrinogen-III synthase
MMHGKRVAILESRFGEQLAELVARYGAEPLRAPALAEVPDLDTSFIRALIADLQREPPAAAVFQTGVGTHALFRATDELKLTEALSGLLAETTVVVRGPKPTAALRSRKVRIDLSAAEPYTTAEVLDVMNGLDLTGTRVVVQRHGGANEMLDRALAERGARVTEVPLYRWSLPADTQPLQDLMDALERGTVDAVAFTSASQAANLLAFAQQVGRQAAVIAGLNKTLVASIGPVCTRALRDSGIAVGVEAHPPKLGPFIQALNLALGSR